MRVVIVDDLSDMRTLLAAYTEMVDNLQIVAMFDGASTAMAWTGWADVDGAFVDWIMPGATGAVLLDWLAAHHPAVRCIILTAHTAALHPHAYATCDKTDLEGAMGAMVGG